MSTALLDREPVIGVITNPNSKKNRRRHNRAAELQAIVGKYGIVRQTTSTEAIGPVIEEFAERGVDFWVSDGGDGALHWMLNKARETLSSDSFALPNHMRYTLPTNGGTIDYVARRAGVRGNAEAILKKLVATYKNGGALKESSVPSLVFTGTQRLRDGTTRPFERIGFAAAIAGVANTFFDKYYEARIPGPKVIVEVVSKAVASLVTGQIPGLRSVVPQEWIAYGRHIIEPMPARVTADGRLLPMTDFTTITVGAFLINLGGVMKMFPLAGKGQMHVSVGDPDMWDIIANIPRMVSGRQHTSKSLYDAPGRELVVEATSSRLLRPNIDGEFFDNVERLEVRPGPRFRIPKIDAKAKI